MVDFSNYIVGAYATSPTLNKWDAKKEIEYIEALKNSLEPIRGLELAFWGELHLYDEELYLNTFNKNWEFVLTTLPANVKALTLNPKIGLASDDENSRVESVLIYKKASEAVKKINNYCGKKSVIAVTIASAPSLKNVNASSSLDSLIKSLKQILEFDWDGAKLVIEHCDSGRVKNSNKGFLSLEEEIEAVTKVNKECNTDIGITINWARSVLEYKDTKGALDHIYMTKKAGLLSGLIFSGTSDMQTSVYGKWSDLHLPVNTSESSSLLTYENIKECINISDVNKLNYIGIKVLAMPIDEATIEKRIAVNLDTLKTLDKAVKGVKYCI